MCMCVCVYEILPYIFNKVYLVIWLYFSVPVMGIIFFISCNQLFQGLLSSNKSTDS